MINLTLELKNKKTYQKKLLDLCVELFPNEMVIPTDLGLVFIPHPDQYGFSDIEIFNKFKRKENGEWVEYYIDTFFYEGEKYRYKRNRNLYNRKDKPIVVKVGECTDECW